MTSRPLCNLVIPCLAAGIFFAVIRAEATPYIFHASETAAPGETISIQGDNFSTLPTVWIENVTGNETSLAPTTQIAVLTNSNQAITARLPKKMPLGLYAVWVKDSSGTANAVPAYINRARGMQFEYGEISPGYTFRIFGRNLALPGGTPTVRFVSGSSSYTATVATTGNDGNILVVTAPAGIGSGTAYTVYTSNGYGMGTNKNGEQAAEQTILGRSGGTDALGLNVPWGADFGTIATNVIDITAAPYNADKTGVTNVLSKIQAAMNAASAAGGGIVYFPTGTYRIDMNTNGVLAPTNWVGLTIPTKVVLKGDGAGATVLHETTTNSVYPQDTFLQFANNATQAGLLNLAISQTVPPTTNSQAPITRPGTGTSKIFYSGISFTGGHTAYPHALGGGFNFQSSNGHDILVQNSTFDYVAFGTPNAQNNGSYYNIRSNTITHHGAWFRTRIEVGGATNTVFESNLCTRDGNWPGADAYEQGGPEAGGAPYLTFLNNSFTATNGPLEQANDGETFNSQGQPPQYDYNTVSSATTNTVTDTTRTWSNNIFAGQVLAIVNGKGTGQWRTVASNTPTTVTTTTSWDETPDATSTYSLTGGMADKWLVKGNYLSEQPRGIGLYTGSHDCAVIGNTLTNVGQSIYLRSDQRAYNGTNWYGRMNLTWGSIADDNVAIDTDGKEPAGWGGADISAPLYVGTNPAGTGIGLAGTIILNTEFRRNVLQAVVPNVKDGAIGLTEGYNSWAIDYNKTFTETGIPGLLATVWDDNTAINTSFGYYLNTDAYQTTVWNTLGLNMTSLISDATISGAIHSSMYTYSGGDETFLEANFEGSGSGTGGASDLVDTGAKGTFIAGSGGCTAATVSTTPFASGSGPYLECHIAASGNAAHMQLTPTTPRTAWGRIFDYRTGHWLVNGGFDFFWRPLQVPTAGNAMRPIDIGAPGTNSLRITFHNSSSSGLYMEIITPTGGGGTTVSGTYAPGFAANGIYHVGVTFSTDPGTHVTTAKIFAASGTTSLSTASTTVGSGGLVAKSTFTISPTVVTNAGGWLSGGLLGFGDVYGNGTANTNDYDDFRMYSEDPGTFLPIGP